MPKSHSFLHAICLLWALAVCVPAAWFLASSVTPEGAAFAVAAISLGVAPWLLSLDEERIWMQRAGMIALGLWLVLTAWVFWRAPDGQARAGARVSNQFVGGSEHYNRKALGAMLPEVDQLLMAFKVKSTIDDRFTNRQAAELSALIRPIYKELEADPDFHALGSAMPEAYDDLWGRKFDHGHYFLYVPKKLDKVKPAPALVFLHGYGGNFKAYTWLLSRVADELGMVIIAPSFGLGNWEPRHGISTVLYALNDAAKWTQIDQANVHLAGLSNGGLGVSQTAARTSGRRFRSLIFFSPVFDEVAINSAGFRQQWQDKNVLVLTGGADDRVPLADVEKAVATMKHSEVPVELKVFDDANHWLIFSHRDAVLAAISEWLRSLKPVPGTDQPPKP